MDHLLDTPPFSLSQEKKETVLLDRLNALTDHHYRQCAPYRKLIDTLGITTAGAHSIEDIPFLPVRLFKEFDLLSVDRSEIVKTLTSSGTSGQRVSRIFLDRATAAHQTKALSRLVSSFIGKKRIPMLVIDSRAVTRDRNLFSARGAGILGFSLFGSEVHYALNDAMDIDFPALDAFLAKHRTSPILVFGFTYIIWKQFYEVLKTRGIRLDLRNGVMIHGGGWKKLLDAAVAPEHFNAAIGEVCGIPRVINYYGMVEQTGAIYMECESGHLHASVFSDVLIRDHRDFSVLPAGQPGIVQLLSALPSSYPGHSLMTEDTGEILGVDDCACGRPGKYFRIHGRLKQAEIRGCSDAFAAAGQS